MTDTNPSGDSFAPAADTQAPAARAETPAGAFGSTRGSGLSRGRRPPSAAAPTATPAASDYKPTAVEIITPEREYKNPFASQEPASAPAAEPAKVETPAEAKPEPEAASGAPVSPEPATEKREIQILPPAEAVRPSVSWESPSASRGQAQSVDRTDRPQRDDRPTFRPDRREDRAGAPRVDGGDARFEGRQPRDPREARQPRDPRDYPQYEQRPRRVQNGGAEPAKPAPKGFFAWLKGLFGGSKPAEAPAGRDFGGEPFNEGHRHRRRHRGGRGHGGNPEFRGDRLSQGGDRSSQGGEYENRGGDHHGGGFRRRRNRGGQGRDRGGDSRSEGHQGGGAI